MALLGQLRLHSDRLTSELAPVDGGGAGVLAACWRLAKGQARLRRSLRRVVRREQPAACLYRGWMLPVERYAELHSALLERGYYLIQAPETYRT